MDICLPFKIFANKFINYILQKQIIRVNHFGHEYDHVFEHFEIKIE